ncbi:hypothetical protein MNAN1_003925 [Malassezia nana]|uniref:Charged multivesicular body protein 7 n=1 Tax=Malassezia nana TaxID=180528 RepID=A0AAF0EN32_9BASI|nr:hypothetical protein MNAN1_003925 [Malassezia nana]
MPLAAQLAALPEAQGERDELVSLYADMSGQRHSNAGAFRRRVAWWAHTLARACWERWDTHGGTLALAVDEDMPNRWAIDRAGRPLCLAVVVEELARQGQLVRVEEYVARRPSPVGRLARALQWVGAPAWRWLVASDEGLSDEALWPAVRGTWVVVTNVERAAELYLASLAPHPALFESVVSRAELEAQLAHLVPSGLNATDTSVLLTHLERDRRALLIEGDVVKLLYHRTDTRGIGEQERGIHAAKQAHARLSRQVDELHTRIDRAQAQAAEAVKRRAPRAVAASYVRSRHQLEEMLTKRVGALDTIRALLLKMEQATGDAEILRAYEVSEQTLRAILADPALQLEHVDAVVDGMAETLAAQEDVQAAMQAAVPADDDELADELAALQLEATAEAPKTPAEATAKAPSEAPAEAASPVLVKAPAVPQHAPRRTESLLESL